MGKRRNRPLDDSINRIHQMKAVREDAEDNKIGPPLGCLPRSLFSFIGGISLVAAAHAMGCNTSPARTPETPYVRAPQESACDAYARAQRLRSSGNFVEARVAYNLARNDPALAIQAIDGLREMDSIQTGMELTLEGILWSFKSQYAQNPAVYDKVIDAALKATVELKEDFHAWCNLGLDYLQAGKVKESRDAYDRAAALIHGKPRDKDFAQVSLGRVQTALFLKDYKTAEELGRAAVKEFPENPYLRDKLVDALSLRGRIDEAIDVLGEGLQTAPNDLTLLWKRADLKLQIRDYFGTIKDYKRLIELDHPQKAILEQNLRQLSELARKYS